MSSASTATDAPADRRVAGLAVLGSAALFGTAGTARALLMPGSPAPGVAAARLFVGGLGFLAYAGRTPDGRRAIVALWRRPVIWAMGVTVAAYQVFFFLSMARTGVAIGTLASLSFTPFMAGVLGWLLKEGAPGMVWAFSTVMAVVGVAMLTVSAGDQRDLVGILFGVCAGASYGVYTVSGVRLARDGEHPTHVLAASFSIAGFLLLPVFVASGTWWLTWSGVALLLWLGLATTTLAYVLFGAGLRVLQPGHIATITLAEPMFATVLGVFVLGEALTLLGWLGCVVIVVALGILGASEGRRSSS